MAAQHPSRISPLHPRAAAVIVTGGLALLAAPLLFAACGGDDDSRPPPAPCTVPGCVQPPPPVGGGGRDSGGGGEPDGGPTDAGPAPDAGPETLQGTALLLDDVVTRSGRPLAGAEISSGGGRAVTTDSRGGFVLIGVVEAPPVYLLSAPSSARVGSLTLATSRNAATVYAISTGDLVDAAAAVGSTHGGTAGVVLARVVDPTGVPRAGVIVSSAAIGVGPFYDRGGAFDRGAAATDSEGAVGFFEVPPGAAPLCVRDELTMSEVCATVPVEPDVATFTTLVLP